MSDASPYWRCWDWDPDDPHQAAIEAEMARIADYREAPRLDRIELLCMPYPEYLRSQHWRTVKQRALYRAGFQCKACEGAQQLDVHHLTYKRRAREAESDLIVLCRGCHAKAHEMLQRCPVGWEDRMPGLVDDVLRDKPHMLSDQHEYWSAYFRP